MELLIIIRIICFPRSLVCLSVCISAIHLLFCLFVCLSVYLSFYLSVHLSICLSVCLSVCLSIRLFYYPSFCLSFRLSGWNSRFSWPMNRRKYHNKVLGYFMGEDTPPFQKNNATSKCPFFREALLWKKKYMCYCKKKT